MMRWENRLMDFIRRHALWVGFALVTVGSLAVRLLLRQFATGDMEVFLIPWTKALREHGIKYALHMPDNNYNVAYMALLWLFSLLPVTEPMAVKLLSILFDFLAAGGMAWAVGCFTAKKGPARSRRMLGAYTLVLLLPVVLANSAIWGQCDIIYTYFLLMCTVFIMQNRYLLGFTMFALALCFKLQAIFFLPVLLVLYCTGRRFSVLQFLSAPFALFVTGLLGSYPGDGLFYGFTKYGMQIAEDLSLYRSYPNIFALFSQQPYSQFSTPSVVFTILVFAMVLVYLLHKGWHVEGDTLVLFAVWCSMTCCMFLPGIHDRYNFYGELMIWLYFLLRPTLKRFLLAMAINFVPVLVYVRVFTLEAYMPHAITSILNMAAYILLGVWVYLALRRENQPPATPATLTAA